MDTSHFPLHHPMYLIASEEERARLLHLREENAGVLGKNIIKDAHSWNQILCYCLGKLQAVLMIVSFSLFFSSIRENERWADAVRICEKYHLLETKSKPWINLSINQSFNQTLTEMLLIFSLSLFFYTSFFFFLLLSIGIRLRNSSSTQSLCHEGNHQSRMFESCGSGECRPWVLFSFDSWSAENQRNSKENHKEWNGNGRLRKCVDKLGHSKACDAYHPKSKPSSLHWTAGENKPFHPWR